MPMYDKDVSSDNFNVMIDGFSMVMEEVTPNESFNRRETIRHNILGGTQSVMRGNYLPRDYTFTTHWLIDPQHPDVYDNIIREWQSKPVEVSSPYMGGMFKAELIIKRTPVSMPNFLALEIQVIEIPTRDSLIPNEKVIIPTTPKSSVVITSSKKPKKNTKSSKTSKKTSKKDSKKKSKKGKDGKKKGSNITKKKNK